MQQVDDCLFAHMELNVVDELLLLDIHISPPPDQLGM